MIVAAQAPSTIKGIVHWVGELFNSPMTVALRHTLSSRRVFCHAGFEEKPILRKMNIPYPNCRPPARRRQKLLQIFCFYFWMIARSLSTSLAPSDISYKGIRRNYTHGRRTGKKWTWRCVAREVEKFDVVVILSQDSHYMRGRRARCQGSVLCTAKKKVGGGEKRPLRRKLFLL